jgi:uncharacterized membrane protein HdeD (DUF308 family)
MAAFFQTFMKSIKYWYIPLIIGILFILIGGYVFTVPLETYVALSTLFSISFIVSGLFDIFFSIQNQKILRGWGWYFVGGMSTLAMGIFLVVYPGISITILPFVVGFTLLFRSFQLLGFSFDLKELKILNWGNTAILSVLGVILSFILLDNPVFTGFSLVTITAITFISVGVSSIVLSFNLKKLKDFPNRISPELKDKIKDLQDEFETKKNENININI